MHYCQIIMLHTCNDALFCKVFLFGLPGPTLSWFRCLPPNTVTSFRYFFEKFVTQYMCSIKRKQSVTSLFHVQMRRSESIRDFMKRFEVTILQHDAVNPNTILKIMKQAIRLNTQFFYLLSLHPPITIDKLL